MGVLGCGLRRLTSSHTGVTNCAGAIPDCEALNSHYVPALNRLDAPGRSLRPVPSWPSRNGDRWAACQVEQGRPGRRRTLELGGSYFTQRDPERATRRAINQLNQLGYTVTLNPRDGADAA